MDYKEKVIALLNDQELSKEQKEKLENIFPELKESKDDRIVRCLLNYFNHVRYNGLDLKGTDIDEVIAWLEKQNEQKHFSDFNANDWYVSKVDGKIHDMTYNPTDKVEPKFRVGDWIIFNGLILHIDEIVNGYYRTTSIGDGIHNSYDWNIDNAARLWTIQDAKEGDVLVSDEVIFIFNKIHGVWVNCHCSLHKDGSFCEKNYDLMHIKYAETIYPATKHERDLLFQKMKEEGYEWDSEKKELKKIEVKTLNADKVIAWLVANICDFEHYVKLFKEDFGLC